MPSLATVAIHEFMMPLYFWHPVGVLLIGMVNAADVCEKRQGPALQRFGCSWEKGCGETHTPEGQLGVWGVQGEPESHLYPPF